MSQPILVFRPGQKCVGCNNYFLFPMIMIDHHCKTISLDADQPFVVHHVNPPPLTPSMLLLQFLFLKIQLEKRACLVCFKNFVYL